MAEDEIVTDHHMARLQALRQQLGRELLGGLGREGEVEMKDEESIDADRLDGTGLGPQGREAKRGIAGLEHFARMGLEGEDRRRPALCRRLVAGGADHRLMAEMHAVEIADRDDRARGIGGDFVRMPENPQRWLWLRWRPSLNRPRRPGDAPYSRSV